MDRPVTTQPFLRDFVAVGIVLLVITVIFADVLFFGSSLVGGDLTQYHYPMKKVVRDLVLGGAFPYWNRLLEAGQPVAANPAYEVFYPAQWLIFLPSFVFGFKLHILVHYYLAALGMYGLIRSLRLHSGAALVAATAFAVGGPLISMNGYLPFLFSLTWLPWALLFAWRFHLHRRPADFALAALALAMQLFIGEPTVFLQSAVLLVVPAALVRRKRAAIALLFTAVAIASVQFVPMIDHMRDSVRSIPLEFYQVSKWSAAVMRPAELFVGSLAQLDRRFAGPGRPFISSIYLGLPIAVFALAGFARRLRYWRTAAVLILAFYVLAIGDHTPLLRLLYRAGLFSAFRFPEKFLLGALFVVILFGASAIDIALREPDSLRRIAMVITLVLLVVSVLAAAMTSPAFVEATWLLPPSSNPQRYVAVDRVEWLGAAIRAVAFLVLLATLRHRTARLALVAFAIVDIVLLTARIPARLPDRFYTDPPPLLSQMPPPQYRVYHQLGLERAISGARPLLGPTQDTQWIVRNEMLPNFPMAWNRATVMGYDADETMLLPSRRFRVALDIAIRQRTANRLTFMTMSNAPFRVVAVDLQSAAREAGGDLERLTTARVVREPIRADRYAFASSLVPCRDVFDCAARLGDADVDVALVPPGVSPIRIDRGVVTRVLETPSTADIDVSTPGTAFLKVSVTFHKYWSATVDGRPVSLVPTNLAYQGLFVPAGIHHIHLKYRNPLIAIGAAISSLTLAALAVLATCRSRVGRRRDDEAVVATAL